MGRNSKPERGPPVVQPVVQPLKYCLRAGPPMLTPPAARTLGPTRRV
jgi:hypothetical protein